MTVVVPRRRLQQMTALELGREFHNVEAYGSVANLRAGDRVHRNVLNVCGVRQAPRDRCLASAKGEPYSHHGALRGSVAAIVRRAQDLRA